MADNIIKIIDNFKSHQFNWKPLRQIIKWLRTGDNKLMTVYTVEGISDPFSESMQVAGKHQFFSFYPENKGKLRNKRSQIINYGEADHRAPGTVHKADLRERH